MERDYTAGKYAISEDTPSTKIGRREWLKATGLGAATALGTLSLGAHTVAADTTGGPENPEDWELVFEDQFESDTLDTSKWDVGFGWGMTSNNDDADVSEDNVVVDEDVLRLRCTHDGSGAGGVYQGAINTRNKEAFGPGHYFEARMRLPGRTGLLPAFWAKPNSEAWPPELDFVELFQTGEDTEAERHTAHYNVHWSTSGQVDDENAHTNDGMTHDDGIDLTETFNTYGCAWHEDRLEFYFNGTRIGTQDGTDLMSAVNAGAPFYMMFTCHVNRFGTPDYSESWEEEITVDWCRVWEHTSESESATSDRDGPDAGDGESADETESDENSSSEVTEPDDENE